MLSPGRRLGQFEVLSVLGQGGMGEVYRARDTRLGRDVALKALPVALAESPERRARLDREAHLLATLSHSGIATLYDLLDDAGTLVLVMELVEGETLDQRLVLGPLSVHQALEAGRQVADALAAAHAKGIVHRDLKPSNIQLTADGRTKLLDFGLAKALESPGAAADVSMLSTAREGLTGEHTVVGTTPYMSPEQLRGEALDQRTDIWSFGCLLYEMLTGVRPFLGRTRSDTIAAVLQKEPDWSALPRATPPMARDTLRRCLQKELARRLHHIADARIELDEALAVIASDQDTTAINVPSVTSKRSRWRRWMGPVAAAAVVSTAVGMAALWPRGEGPPPTARGRVRVAVLAPQNTGVESATTGWPDLTQALFVRELIGVEGLAVLDPMRLNGVIQEALGPGPPRRGPALYAALHGEALAFLVDGSIVPVQNGYRLQSNVIEAASGVVRSSHGAVVTREEQLGDAVAGAARNLLEFLEREGAPVVADKDLRPWLSRSTDSVEAMKAFMTYSRYALRHEPGGIPHLERAIALDPTFVSPRVWRIPSLVAGGRMAPAQEDYRVLQGLALKASAFDQAMIDWVGAYLAGDPAAEVRHLERALQYAPDNNILLVNLAESRLTNGDLQGALKALEPALRIRWSYPALYTLQGTILIRQGRLAEAKEALREATELPAVDPEVYGMLSALHRRDGAAADADRYAALYAGRCEELDWDAPKQQDMLGGYLASVGLHDLAIRALRQAIALDPGVAARHVHLAEALHNAGRLAEAEAACARALELDPEASTAQLVLGRVYEDQDKRLEALRRYEAYLATGPRGPALRDVEARVAHLRDTQTPLHSGR